MKTPDKEKICINCEGRIPQNIEQCTYCGVDQKSAQRAPIFQNQSLEDSLASLYTPPYQAKRPQFVQPQEPQEQPAQQQHAAPFYQEPSETVQMDPLLGSAALEEEEVAPAKSALLPTILLFSGANVLFLGLMQLFFSKNGVLRLEWNAHYWFLYCIFAVPCLFLGYRKFKEL